MVNPGAFQGARKVFLLGEKPTYSAAVSSGFVRDVLANIQRRFLKRFPIDLPPDQEPSPEQLAAVDDEAPDPDVEEPDRSKLSPEEYDAAMKKMEERKKLLNFRRGQIKRWLAYQYMKDHDIDPKDSGIHNPYRILLQTLTGTTPSRPRLKSALNVWRDGFREAIEKETNRQAEAKGVSRKKLAPLREMVAKAMYNDLSTADKAEWAALAKAQHAEAVKTWEEELDSPISTEPEDRQRCIQGLVKFIQPIIDIVNEATGWKSTFIAGGPEPAHEGRLNMISIHSGTTTGDVKMNFGRAEQARYQKYVVPIYADFLRKCYSLQECRSRALPIDQAFERINNLDLGDVDVHSISQEGFEDNEDTSSPWDNNQATEQPTSESASAPMRQPTSELASAPVRQDRIAEPAEPTEAGAAASPAINHASPPSPTRQPPSPLVLPRRGSESPRSLPPSPAPSPPRSAPPSPLRSAPPSPPHSPVLLVPASPLRPAHDGMELEDAPKRITAPTPEPEPSSDAVPAVQPTNEVIAASTLAAGRVTRNQLSKAATNDKATIRAPSKRKRVDSTTIAKANGNATQSDAKKARMSVAQPPPTAAPSTSSPASAVNAAPEWFNKVLELFRSQTLPDDLLWKALIESWVNFETKEGFVEVRRLAAKGRPEPVNQWIARARSTTWRPTVTSVNGFDREFQIWWSALQPTWRVRDGIIDRRNLDGDWTVLKAPGLNGLQSVVVALFYWGINVNLKKTAQRKGWEAAVTDCLQVFNHLCL